MGECCTQHNVMFLLVSMFPFYTWHRVDIYFFLFFSITFAGSRNYKKNKTNSAIYNQLNKVHCGISFLNVSVGFSFSNYILSARRQFTVRRELRCYLEFFFYFLPLNIHTKKKPTRNYAAANKSSNIRYHMANIVKWPRT